MILNGKPKRSKQQHSPAELRGFIGLKMKKLLISILLMMSSAVFALPTSPSVTFGAVDPNPPNPATFNKYDGSVYVKTSDGTDTGDVLQIWHYSIKHNKWVAAPNIVGQTDMVIEAVTGTYKPAAQIDITTAPINTGLNLNDADFLFIQFKDANTGNAFGVQMYELAAIRDYGNKFYVWNQDKAYLHATITNYATGTFTIKEVVRQAALYSAWTTKRVTVKH